MSLKDASSPKEGEGWHADPLGSENERYFDGTSWTPQVRKPPASSERRPTPKTPSKKQPRSDQPPREIEVQKPQSDPAAIKQDERQEARELYEGLLTRISQGDASKGEELTDAQTLAQATEWSARKLKKLNRGAIRGLVEGLLADGRLTPEEYDAAERAAEALGVSFDEALRGGLLQTDLSSELVLGAIRDGYLPAKTTSDYVSLPDDEVCHGEYDAQLLRQYTVRESKGRYSVGIGPIRTYGGGGSRVIGTEWRPVDQGALVVTSERVLYVGSTKTIESRYSKLLRCATEGQLLQINVSNRQTPVVVEVANAELAAVVAAIVEEAARRAR